MNTNENINYKRLIDNLKYLKLSQFEIHLESLIKKSNTLELSLVDSLLTLTDYEVEAKRIKTATAMIKTANFPHTRGLNEFDFSFNENIDEDLIKSLCTLKFLDTTENIIFLGNSGVGKTHLSIAIGLESARNRYSTYFIKCHDLLSNLKKAQLENRLENRIKHYSRYRLLIIDELGYLPLEPGDERLLFQLIDKRYENKSTIVTTNINFSEWAELFYNENVASAILDRLLHHSTVIPITGQSYRLKDHFIEEEEV